MVEGRHFELAARDAQTVLHLGLPTPHISSPFGMSAEHTYIYIYIYLFIYICIYLSIYMNASKQPYFWHLGQPFLHVRPAGSPESDASARLALLPFSTLRGGKEVIISK